MFSRMWHNYNFCAQGLRNDRCGERMQGWRHELGPFGGSELCFGCTARQEAKAEVRALTWVVCVCVCLCLCARAHTCTHTYTCTWEQVLETIKTMYNVYFLMSGTACCCALSDSPSLGTLGLGKTRTYIDAHFFSCFTFIYLCRSSRQESWSGLPFPSPVGHVLQTPPPWALCLGWPHTSWLSFIELDKLGSVWSDWLVVCDRGFSLSALWHPLSAPSVLLGFLLPWTWGNSSWLLQQSAAAAPYLQCGVWKGKKIGHWRMNSPGR